MNDPIERQAMTNEKRRKAAEWFRNRAKNCPMPGARRMYEIATEALEMAIRALEGDGDTISRQAAMVVFENSGLDDDSKDTVVRVLEQLPSAHPTYTDEEIQKMQDLESAEIEKAYQLGYEDGKVKPHWIPVSERPPKKDGRYQVTRLDYVTDTKFIDILWYEKNTWWNRQATGDYAVIAWMPLPKPYGGEANEMQ